MELTKQQIDQLFAFTERKMVRWYDIQVEIVDHLAARIEEKMSADKDLTFEVALRNVYAGFGLFGFAKIVQEKEKGSFALGKRNFKAKLKQQFNWPTILRTLCIFTLSYLAATWLSRIQFCTLIAVLFVIASVLAFYRDKVLHKMKKNLMMLYSPSSLLDFFVYWLPINTLLQFIFDGSLSANLPLQYPITWSIITSLIVLYSIITFTIKIDLRNEARQLYPEAFA